MCAKGGRWNRLNARLPVASIGCFRAFLLMLLVAGCTPIPDERKIGWGGLSWDMTKDQIRVLLPQAHEYSMHGIYHSMNGLFGFSDWNEYGCKSDVDFFFTRGKLRTLAIYATEHDPVHAQSCERAWLDALSARNGPPRYRGTFDEHVFIANVLGWRSQSSDIILSQLQFGVDPHSPDIEYRTRGSYRELTETP